MSDTRSLEEKEDDLISSFQRGFNTPILEVINKYLSSGSVDDELDVRRRLEALSAKEKEILPAWFKEKYKDHQEEKLPVHYSAEDCTILAIFYSEIKLSLRINMTLYSPEKAYYFYSEAIRLKKPNDISALSSRDYIKICQLLKHNDKDGLDILRRLVETKDSSATYFLGEITRDENLFIEGFRHITDEKNHPFNFCHMNTFKDRIERRTTHKGEPPPPEEEEQNEFLNLLDLKNGVSRGYLSALEAYGMAYYGGLLGERDIDKANALFEIASARGSEIALYYQGKICAESHDAKKALDYFCKSAEAGCEKAVIILDLISQTFASNLSKKQERTDTTSESWNMFVIKFKHNFIIRHILRYRPHDEITPQLMNLIPIFQRRAIKADFDWARHLDEKDRAKAAYYAAKFTHHEDTDIAHDIIPKTHLSKIAKKNIKLLAEEISDQDSHAVICKMFANEKISAKFLTYKTDQLTFSFNAVNTHLQNRDITDIVTSYLAHSDYSSEATKRSAVTGKFWRKAPKEHKDMKKISPHTHESNSTSLTRTNH